MKQTTRVKYAVALAGTALLAACGTESGGGGAGGEGKDEGKTKVANTEDVIADTYWVPQKVTVDGKTYTLPKDDRFRVDEAHITFKPDSTDPEMGGGESGGTVGCNSFGADVEIQGDTVKLTDLASTAMGCQGPVGEFESKFLSVFDGTLKAAVEEPDGTRTLTLSAAGGDSITLREGTPQPSPALQGTRWTIDTLLSGKGDDATASSLPEDAKAHLTLTKDGKATGSLGCNTFTAEATVKDGTIEFGPLATTRKVCSPPVMKTERELTEILADKVSYQQKQDSLTLTAASGKGLVARTE
ncbi:META domain-containing protein [Streptomyces sp. S.PB5]|uniref:META domain-containing protein n=1 Tax=Streptomyces sp. S.PB5 TaxID=3020844 RepID=UPI0025AED6CF|nr:META domain-containing protein [Streptomyces sp. S.PB5]MDN3023903.1 META domain-containing protein [Streptomyces sp. S.PB5]